MSGGKGIDIITPNSDGKIIRVASLQDADGVIVTTGTTNYYLYRLTSSGNFEVLNANDGSWVASGGSPPVFGAMNAAHKTGYQNGDATADLGLWIAVLTTTMVAGLDAGRVYFELFINSNATPVQQVRMWQFRNYQGDLPGRSKVG